MGRAGDVGVGTDVVSGSEIEATAYLYRDQTRLLQLTSRDGGPLVSGRRAWYCFVGVGD